MCVSAYAVCATPLHVCTERGAEAWLEGTGGGVREGYGLRRRPPSAAMAGLGGWLRGWESCTGLGGSVMRGFFFLR